MEQDLDKQKTDEIFYQAGHLAGTEFYKNVLGQQSDFNEFVRSLQNVLKDMGIGILRVE